MSKGTAKYIRSCDGARIFYEVTPCSSSKPCLFFIHGFGGNSSCWDKERAFFAKLKTPTIGIDLRGHGKSDRAEEKSFYSLGKFVEDIVAVMEAEKHSRYVLVGHCFGGMISILLEATHPKISKGLVLVDTNYKAPKFTELFHKHGFFKEIFELVAKNVPNIKADGYVDYNDFVGTWDWDPKRILTDAFYTSLKSYLLISKQIFGFDATDLLKKIHVPTLIIEGANDTMVPPDVAIDLKARIKNSYLDILPGANHILVVNNPKDLSEEIENFLNKERLV